MQLLILFPLWPSPWESLSCPACIPHGFGSQCIRKCQWGTHEGGGGERRPLHMAETNMNSYRLMGFSATLTARLGLSHPHDWRKPWQATQTFTRQLNRKCELSTARLARHEPETQQRTCLCAPHGCSPGWSGHGLEHPGLLVNEVSPCISALLPVCPVPQVQQGSNVNRASYFLVLAACQKPPSNQVGPWLGKSLH